MHFLKADGMWITIVRLKTRGCDVDLPLFKEFFEVMMDMNQLFTIITFFSQHFANANTNVNLPIECGLGLESRRRTPGSGFRHVAGGSDAKILNVSTNVLNICHLIRY